MPRSLSRGIAVTDRISPPLAHDAKVVFPAGIESQSFVNSYVAMLYICERLFFEISRVDSQRQKQRLEKINRSLDEIELC